MTKINISKKQKKDAVIALVVVIVAIGGSFGFLRILKLTLKTNNPLVIVISESMEPTIYRGDLLIIQGMDPAEIENETIILYNSLGLWPPPHRQVEEPIVHRVISKYMNETDGKWYFITLGDNNDDTDPPGSVGIEIPVPEDRVIGIVRTIIPKIGLVKMWLEKTPFISTIILVGLSISLLISIIWDFTHPEKNDENEEEFEENADNKPEKKSAVDLGI